MDDMIGISIQRIILSVRNSCKTINNTLLVLTTENIFTNKGNAEKNFLDILHQNVENFSTFPSYSFRWRTSGAMYAGVPTVDLGCECNKADCKA